MQKDITIKYDKAGFIQPKIKRYDQRQKKKERAGGGVMAPLQFIILPFPPILK